MNIHKKILLGSATLFLAFAGIGQQTAASQFSEEEQFNQESQHLTPSQAALLQRFIAEYDEDKQLPRLFGSSLPQTSTTQSQIQDMDDEQQLPRLFGSSLPQTSTTQLGMETYHIMYLYDAAIRNRWKLTI